MMRIYGVKAYTGLHRVAILLTLVLCSFPMLGITAVAMKTTEANEFQGMDDIAVLQEHGTYTVAYADNYLPFSYTDSDGNATGMAISIMDYIAQIAGIEVTYVSVANATRYDIPVDINLAILIKDQIEGVSIQSTSYTSLQMMAISDTPILSPSHSATVGHLPYYYLDDSAIQNALPGCVSYVYFSYTEMVEAYYLGDLDYMLVSSLISSQMLETSYPDDVYTIPTSVSLDMFMSYADHLSLAKVAAFNSLILNLDADYIYSLMLSSVIAAADVEITPLKILQTYAAPILGFTLIGFVAFVAIILRLNRTKRKFLETAINVDELTGLMTERKFMAEVSKALQSSEPGGCYIITTDIDNFKFINEIYGYEVGTKAILLYAEMLQEIFPSGTPIARLFADSFAILYKGASPEKSMCTDEEYEAQIAQKMFGLLGEGYRLTTSTGIYQIDNFSLPLSYMIDCANVARRRGKSSYGITKNIFTKAIEQRIQQKNDIVLSMEHAIEEKEFKIYYQPKISLKTGALVGAEALLRWVRSDGQIQHPADFIPLFESNGFIVKVDFFVFENVCAFLECNPQVPKVSVNFSGFSMLNPHLVDRIQAITQAHHITSNRLEIEITESAVVKNFDPIVKQTTRLQALGFDISMDDFGAGISSLNRLKDLDIDVLKIDKAFLEEEVLSPRSVSIMEHIIGMSRELGIATIAEGVEHQGQEALLQSLGCDMVQGYYYAKPMPEQDYLDYIQAHLPPQ